MKLIIHADDLGETVEITRGIFECIDAGLVTSTSMLANMPATDFALSEAEKYEGKVRLDNVLMSIAVIYKNELEDKVMAKETLERLIKEYPKSRLVEKANELLKEMEES